jgi:hypothetical protein
MSIYNEQLILPYLLSTSVMYYIGFCYNRNVQDYETTPFVDIFYQPLNNNCSKLRLR